MELDVFLNNIIFNIFEGLILLFIFLILINRRNFIQINKFKTLIFISIYAIFSYWATVYMPVGYHSIAIISFSIICLSLITSTSLLHSFMGILISAIFFMVTELIVFASLSIFNHIKISDIINSPIIKLQMSIITRILQISMLILLYKSKKIFWRNIQPSSNTMLSYFILGIFLMGIFIFNVSFAVSTKENIFLYEILLSSIFLLFIFLGALVYQEKKQLLKIEHVYKSQQEYIQNMETIMNIIRREKHDFSNHLSTIHAMCVLNKPNTPEKIKAYIDKLANSLHSSYRYFNTGNDFIDGLLAVKSNFAFNHNIHFEVDFEIPLDHLSVEDENLISILSNIIDNAFDAIATDEDTENKVVSICTYAEDHRHYLSVSNNGPMISKENIDKIFSNGYSSKTNNKGDHGLGLYIVKQLIEKNNGTITVSSNEEETNFLIRFNKEKINHGKTSPQHH